MSADGTRLRGTCGATLIAPSFAITASHCVNSVTTDLLGLELEMYRLGRVAQNAAPNPLDGQFPGFTPARLGSAEGYFTDRYSCTVVGRCGKAFGPTLRCDEDKSEVGDAALLFCDGAPGLKYGSLELAEEDRIEAPLFMPWKHELYSYPDGAFNNADSQAWQHYGIATANPADNYHYFGNSTAGAATNQLIPLISIGLDSELEPAKLSASNTGVGTDLLGCHGTSGSGVLQQSSAGQWQLLGPVRSGNPEHDGYLCNHIPSLDGSYRGPGNQGLNYTLLSITGHLVEQARDELDADRALVAKPQDEPVSSVILNFDSAAQRRLIKLRDLESPVPTPHEARFVGDGESGFSAYLTKNERLIVANVTLEPVAQWIGKIATGEPRSPTEPSDAATRDAGSAATVTCGLLDTDGNVVTNRACDDEWFRLDDPKGEGVHFFVQSTDSIELQIDEIRLSQAESRDQDADGVPDAIDECPAVGTAGILNGHANALTQTCTPAPLKLHLTPPIAPSTCDELTHLGWLTHVGGRELAQKLLLDDGDIKLPLGRHSILWELGEPDGGTTIIRSEINIRLSSDCCSQMQTVYEGSAEDDAWTLATSENALCLSGANGDDFMLSGGGTDYLSGGSGSDYLRSGKGLDTLLGGPGPDYLSGEGQLSVFAGPGDDTVHAGLAERSLIYGNSGADFLLGSPGPDLIFPGSETRLVQAGAGADTVRVLAACELGQPLELDGGEGFDRLYLPVSEQDAIALSASIVGFEEIIVDNSQAYLSDCFGTEERE